MASTGSLTVDDEAPLHPNIRDIVSLATAHTQKVYFSGPVRYRGPGVFDYDDVWAQLTGTILSVKKANRVGQQGKEVHLPSVNVADAAVELYEVPKMIFLYTAVRYPSLICHSDKDFISWVAAFRLSRWEKSRLDEIYTAQLIRTTINDSRNAPSTLTDGRLEGWVRVKAHPHRKEWKRLWMCVSAGTITKALVLGLERDTRDSTRVTPKKRGISGLFSRNKSNDPPEQANIVLYDDQRRKYSKPVLKFNAVTQAFAVYPERPELISSRALIKLEGTCCDEEVLAAGNKGAVSKGWMLLMPDLEDSGIEEMLRWLIAIHDAFGLYGRPKTYSWDPRDPASMMSAYPTGPGKQLLFLDREAAEALGASTDLDSVVRSKLLDIAVKRMRKEGGASSTSDSLTATMNTKTLEPAPFAQIDLHPSSLKLSPIPTTLDSPSTLTRTTTTTTTTSQSEYSKYSGGVGPGPAQRVPGAFSLLYNRNPGSYPQSHQRQHYDEYPNVLATSTFLEPGEANATPNSPSPLPPQEGRGRTSDVEADVYYTPSDSGDDASQDRNSLEGKPESSFAPPRQGSAKPQAQQDLVESSNLGPIYTATASVSASACGCLIRRAFALHELPSLVEAVFSSNDAGDTIRSLVGEDAQTFVDVIDEALDMPELPPRIRKMCLKSLYRMCGHHALLPSTLKIPVCYDRTGTASYRGGFADVWKGKHCGRAVAVKVIRTYSDDDLQRVIGRFCKEAVTWKTLRHPNILPLIGVTMSETQFAMISDWMVNGNINDFVKAHPDVNRLALLEDVAWGLIYIHSQGMIHGDLKGTNILIDQTGHARLADFGLLTIIKDPTNLLASTTYTQGGSARWMSPELIDPQQFGLQHSRPTEFSDCYALGMVIYETISGNLPFHEDADLTVFVKVIQGKRPPRGAKFRKDLWMILEQCWESQPSNRPSVGDVLRCLETYTNPS